MTINVNIWTFSSVNRLSLLVVQYKTQPIGAGESVQDIEF